MKRILNLSCLITLVLIIVMAGCTPTQSDINVNVIELPIPELKWGMTRDEIVETLGELGIPETELLVPHERKLALSKEQTEQLCGDTIAGCPLYDSGVAAITLEFQQDLNGVHYLSAAYVRLKSEDVKPVEDWFTEKYGESVGPGLFDGKIWSSVPLGTTLSEKECEKLGSQDIFVLERSTPPYDAQKFYPFVNVIFEPEATLVRLEYTAVGYVHRTVGGFE